MNKIVPFLWFDDNAEEAARLYTSLFDRSKIGTIRRYGDAGPGPKGKVMTLSFELEGQPFMALNGGPTFSFTPAVSFFVSCRTEKEVDSLWAKLSERGTIYMELQKYPFSEKFGWVGDRFGVSWQLSVDARERGITPYFLFVGKQCGRAEDAMKNWVSQFLRSSIDHVLRCGPGEDTPEGAVRLAHFTLEGQTFMAADSGFPHAFDFTPALSFFVNCATQPEIDRLWEGLSKGGRKDQCGWLQDAYGVSWQIVPTVLGDLLDDPDPVRSKRVTEAMLKMTKLDIEGLKRAAKQ
jgi:predicted 3-demethylubiquinone-9 3-methyltransferase (glyoxalase superfamily)